MAKSMTAPSPQPSPQGERVRAGTTARDLFKDIARTARLMVGVPDYEAYVAHRKAVHPDEPVMSYEEFFKERQASRYGANGGKISRCC